MIVWNAEERAHLQAYRDYYAGRKLSGRAAGPHAWQPELLLLAHMVGASTVLDYGAGEQKQLERHWRGSARVVSYDPGVAPVATLPCSDIVVCHHVGEHLLPESVAKITSELWALTQRALYFAVSLSVSTKRLPNGTPWHSCVRTSVWWENALMLAAPSARGLVLTNDAREFKCVLFKKY